MGELAQLLLAIAGLISSIGGAAAAIIASMRTGKRDRASARKAQDEADTEDEYTPPEEVVNIEDIKAIVDFIGQAQHRQEPPE